MIDSSSKMAGPFQISSVQASQPPPNAQGMDWHCYTIVQGANKIRGYRQGSYRAVRMAVEEIVAQLNERRMGKRGRVNHVVPTVTKPVES